MECRAECGACCKAISISSSIPGMPNGKPAGVSCIHLTNSGLCGIFNSPSRPQICIDFRPSREFCGSNNIEAYCLITAMELLTSPEK